MGNALCLYGTLKDPAATVPGSIDFPELPGFPFLADPAVFPGLQPVAAPSAAACFQRLATVIPVFIDFSVNGDIPAEN